MKKILRVALYFYNKYCYRGNVAELFTDQFDSHIVRFSAQYFLLQIPSVTSIF